MRAPLESKSRTESFGPMAQAATSFSDGNAVPQAGIELELETALPASREKATGQVLSRAALEISQAPTIAWAASLGTGACAAAPAANSATAITAKTRSNASMEN